MLFLKRKLKKFLYTRAVRSFMSASSVELQTQSEQKAIAAFDAAYQRSPPYRAHLQKTGFQNTPIRNIEDFKKYVPVSTKDMIYGNTSWISKHLPLEPSPSFLLSSGSSGIFSFGIHSQHHINQQTEFLNALFSHYFHILDQKTLIINCLGQAVRLPALDAAIIETGPRTDALLYILEKLSPQFEQTILVGDNYFVKNSLEDGLNRGIPLSRLCLQLILGGVYLPETLRTYLAELLNNKTYNGLILSSMGISEFGLNLFVETPETITLRQWAEKNPVLSQKIFGDAAPFTPMFFNYFPQAFYIEEVHGEIVITNLNTQALLPLIRYNAGDKGRSIPYEDLKHVDLGEIDMATLRPPFKSPLVLIYGKNEYVETPNKIKIYPQQVQKGLYEHIGTASLTTGYFRLNTNNGMSLQIQLKQGIQPNEAVTQQFRQAILQNINVDIPLILYPYHLFPYGMGLDYERKFKYL